jgi:glutathione peroxidase
MTVVVGGLLFLAGCGDCGSCHSGSPVASADGEQPPCCQKEDGNCENCEVCKGAALKPCPACQEPDAAAAAVPAPAADDPGARTGAVPPVLKFSIKTIDGKPVDLAKYQGKVILFVNVASQCGYTKQYAGLQALHDRYADKGLVIVGVPSNDFGQQEPGTDAEIAEFCKSKYGVKFDMLSKVHVAGKEKCPLYQYLTTHAQPAGEVKWNFEKFLVARNGDIVARFPSSVEPESEELTKAVEAALAKK